MPAEIDNLTIPAGSNLALSAPVTVRGTMNWGGGTMGDGTLTVVVDNQAGGTINLESGATAS